MFKSALISLVATCAIAAPAYAAVPSVGPVAKINIAIAPALTAKTRDFNARDFETLERELRRSVQNQLTRKGVLNEAGGTLDLVIEDVTATRPTFTQMSMKPGLSMDSFGLGGVKLSGTYKAADGAVTPISYDWYETDIRDAHLGWTWQGATDGFERFALSLTKS
jgi:hypothetical protein